MVVSYLDFIVDQMIPAFFSLLDSLMITSNVSWLGLSVAVLLLCIVIGAILMRV